MPFLKNLKHRAHLLKTEAYALYLAARHPKTPWYAKLIVAVVAAYAVSPIDLIPDFIPILGYLDDLILIPAGMALALKMIPPSVMAECRKQAQTFTSKGRQTSLIAGIVIVLIWMAAAVFCIKFIFKIAGKKGEGF